MRNKLRGWWYRIVSWFLGRPLGGQKRVPTPLEDLREYAEWSFDVYSDTHTLKAKYGPTILAEGFPRTHMRAFILPQFSRTVLALRGTTDLRNAFEDLDIRERGDLLPTSKVKFHRGFERCAAEVLEWAKKNLPKDKPVVLTGHSLGGAVAVILLHVLREEGYVVPQAVTFGQPKVTNGAGVEKLRGLPLLRVVHEGDPVPLVPPLELLGLVEGRYAHFGTEFLVQDDGQTWFLKEHAAERMAVSSFWVNLPHIHPLNHKMESYIRALERALRR